MKIYSGKIKPGEILAVHTGVYAGELLLNVKNTGVDCCFLAIPTMVNRIIPKAAILHAIKTGIIKFVEKAPNYVLKVSIEQYNKNENINNRRQQSNPPNLLDGENTVQEK